jgi:hypothetical protein
MECTQGMAHVLQRCASRVTAGGLRRFLRKEIDDSPAIGACPGPQATGLGLLRLAVVAKILVQRRPLLAQAERQALAKVVVRADAVGDGCRPAQEDVAGYLINHWSAPRLDHGKTSKTCQRRATVSWELPTLALVLKASFWKKNPRS